MKPPDLEPLEPEPLEPAVVVEEFEGVWSAMINLGGEYFPLGYFGSREDAEETIAAYQNARPAGGAPAEAERH